MACSSSPIRDPPGAARIDVPDDGPLAAEQLSGCEIATKAMELLRANYVFPDEAERAAAAIQARPAAGEYDGLDEIMLTDRVTQSPAGHHRGQAPAAAAGRRTWAAPPLTSKSPSGAEDAHRWGGWTTSASAGSSG